MNAGRNAAKKIAVLAMLTGLSLIMFLIENLFPTILPGARMGLANIFSLVALIMYSPLEAFAVVVIRTFLGAVFAGNISMVLYSLTGGVVSMAVSSVFLYTLYPAISIMSISIAAAVAHNITQNIVFVFVSGTALIFGYMPYLVLLGILSGAIVGGVTLLIFRGLPLNLFAKIIHERKKNLKHTDSQITLS